MTETIKEKSFYEAQKYIATQEWIDIREEANKEIETLKDYILEDAVLPQDIVYSRNQIRWLCNQLISSYITRINNAHLQQVLRVCIMEDNNERLLIVKEKSEDLKEFSDKDWLRRKRYILRYIVEFDRIYWQEKESDNNGSVEDWQNSLSQGIFI